MASELGTAVRSACCLLDHAGKKRERGSDAEHDPERCRVDTGEKNATQELAHCCSGRHSCGFVRGASPERAVGQRDGRRFECVEREPRDRAGALSVSVLSLPPPAPSLPVLQVQAGHPFLLWAPASSASSSPLGLVTASDGFAWAGRPASPFCSRPHPPASDLIRRGGSGSRRTTAPGCDRRATIAKNCTSASVCARALTDHTFRRGTAGGGGTWICNRRAGRGACSR